MCAADDDWNYVHNMMYAIANLMEQGRLADANALSDHLSAARGKLSRSSISGRRAIRWRGSAGGSRWRCGWGDWDTILSMLGQISFQGDRTINLPFTGCGVNRVSQKG